MIVVVGEIAAVTHVVVDVVGFESTILH